MAGTTYFILLITTRRFKYAFSIGPLIKMCYNNFQVCSEACESSEWHKEECEILCEAGIACDIYDFEETTFSMDFMGSLRLALAIKKSKDSHVRL